MSKHKIIAISIIQINDTIPVGVSGKKTLLVACNNLVLLYLKIKGVPYVILEKSVKHDTKHPNSRLKPFGGGLKLENPEALLALLKFNYLTAKAKQEQDFRLLIENRNWETIRHFAIHNLKHPETGILESNPTRELGEELCIALGIPLLQEQASSSNYYYLIREMLGINHSETIIAHSPSYISTLEPAPIIDNQYPGVEHRVKINYIHNGQVLDSKLIARIIHEANQPLKHLITDSLFNGRKKLSTISLVHIDDFIRAYVEQKRHQKVKIDGITCSSNTTQLFEAINRRK